MRLSGLVLCLLSTLLVHQVTIACDQISPNPNPSGSTVTNSSTNGCNSDGAYTNNGTFNNRGFVEFAGEGLENNGVVNNRGEISHVTINNAGLINNYGHIRDQSVGSAIVSTGVINNYGVIDNFGVVNNQGLLLNSGRLNNFHDVVNNEGITVNRGTIETQGGFWNSALMINLATITTQTDRGLYAQSSGVTLNEGTIRQMEVRIDGGLLQGNGTIDVTSPYAEGKPPTNRGLVVNGGAINAGSLGRDTGTLTVRGDMTFNGGSLITEIASAGLVDLLRVTDTASFLAGTFTFSFLDRYRPNLGDEWTFLTAGKGITGWENLSLAYAGIPNNYLFDVSERGNSLVLSVAAIPEPEVYAMIGLGLGFLGWISRRQRALRTNAA